MKFGVACTELLHNAVVGNMNKQILVPHHGRMFDVLPCHYCVACK